ncbi:hypothetical protein WH52_01160 [Tenacibaculum holothuriorum]|uniref:Cyclic nucleotide-binding domain-containing protein n=1 Tax=Tenacibaculum holothuriorum TaxID=1635173 RepID=A0A1Y2PGI5_9FLAO|nr:hypothetical protein WH52_01160 [Tenacibaculum holothuriorum]
MPSSALQPLLNHISVIEKNKGTLLIKQGYRHSYSYFILQGLARVFYQKGDSEINFWFGLENEPLGSMDTLKGNASKVSIELLEPCRLIQFNIASLQKELKDDPVTITLLRTVMEEYAIFLEERLFGLQGLSANERYKYLLQTEPSIFQRVSSTYIASYLGMSRETLSRLRSKSVL